VSGRFSQARIIAVDSVRGPDHIAIRTWLTGRTLAGSWRRPGPGVSRCSPPPG